MYAHYQVLALPQMYFLFILHNTQTCKINNRKVRDVSKGGGGGGLQKNVHMTFLVGKIDM